MTLYNVVAVNIYTGARSVLETGKSKENADAIVKMAVMRRGAGVPDIFVMESMEETES